LPIKSGVTYSPIIPTTLRIKPTIKRHICFLIYPLSISLAFATAIFNFLAFSIFSSSVNGLSSASTLLPLPFLAAPGVVTTSSAFNYLDSGFKSSSLISLDILK